MLFVITREMANILGARQMKCTPCLLRLLLLPLFFLLADSLKALIILDGSVKLSQIPLL